jgi:hypothetical protein
MEFARSDWPNLKAQGKQMKHSDPHPLAGKTVKIAVGAFAGSDYRLEDWWDHLTGKSWMYSDGNPAAMEYAIRSGLEALPLDDDVVYGKIGAYGQLIHVSQLGEVFDDPR